MICYVVDGHIFFREETDCIMDSSPIRGLILCVVILILNFIMYCFGEASQNINQSDLEEKAEGGNRKAKKLLKVVDKPRRFITTIQLTGTAFAIAVGFYELRLYGSRLAEFMLEQSGVKDGMVIVAVSYLLTAIALLIVLLAVGIIVPQRIGRGKPDKWAYRLIDIVNTVVVMLTPLSMLATLLAKIILKICGIDYSDEIDNVTEEEIISIVNEGHEQGILEEQEAEMISNIIELDEKEASEIMTHRTNVVAIDGNWTLAETVEFIINENNSRFPVYDEDIDNIIGILHIRDVFTCYKKGGLADKPIKEFAQIIREPKFIPETRCVDTLFREMQKDKNHMVIVIDEYGQTAGILTMEDILEEIVGNILDEYDEEDDSIICESDNVYVVKGTTPLKDIEDVIGIQFNEEDYDTLNGFLISELGRIPDEDEDIVLEIYECRYEVLAIEGKMISLVKVTMLEKKSNEDTVEEQ